MKKLALAISACVLATGGAHASTVSYTDTFGLAATNFTHAVGASRFNTALGTLNSATFMLTGDIVQALRAENLGGSPQVLTPLTGANFFFRKSATVLQTLALNNSGTSFSATAYDGILDFNGTSGIDFGNLTSSGTRTFTFTGAELSDLIGPGTLGTAGYDIRVTGAGSINSDNGNLVTSIVTQGRYNLALTYDFTPTATSVPEPSSLAMVGLALVGASVVRRKVSKA